MKWEYGGWCTCGLDVMGATPSSSASASEAANTCTQENRTVTLPAVRAVALYSGHLLTNDLGTKLSEVRVCRTFCSSSACSFLDE